MKNGEPSYNRKPELVGHGTRSKGRRGGPDSMKQLCIRVDDETFDEVRRRAMRAGVSAAEILRQVIEWGLMDVDKA